MLRLWQGIDTIDRRGLSWRDGLGTFEPATLGRQLSSTLCVKMLH